MKKTLLLLVLIAAAPAGAYNWTYLAMDGESCTCIEADTDHERIFVGTQEGFFYLDQGSGVWTDRDWDGWIGRRVHSIQWHPGMDQRVITGRQNAFFKGYIEVSDDLGASETLAYNSNGGGVSDLDSDGSNFYACTWPDVAPGEFLRSVDEGDSWTLLGGHGHYAMTAMTTKPGGEILLCGDNRVTRSWDFGASWNFVGGGLPGGELTHCIAYAYDGGDIITELSHFAGTDNGIYFAEMNDAWVQKLNAGARNLVTFGGLYLVRGDLVAAVTFDGRIMVSSSFGESWTDETGDLPGTPVDIAYSPYDNGLYVCTESDGVFTIPNIITATESTPVAKAPTLTAWPNPFNPRTTLSFSLPTTGHARLEVFDVNGRRVATLLDGTMDAGRHELNWDAEGLAGGLYLARLRMDSGHEQTIKAVLLQ